MTIGVHQYDWVIKKLLFDDTLKIEIKLHHIGPQLVVGKQK